MIEPENTILFIGRDWPDPKRTAAGWRMMQLIQYFRHSAFSVHFATTYPVSETLFEDVPEVNTLQIALNDDHFDIQIKAINPDYVVFDRFMTEEQYGWRVRQNCPKAMTLLDTEDCHFLRLARAAYIKEHAEAFDAYGCEDDVLFTQHSMRELASIWRCDLTLIISEYEYALLTQLFSVPESLLYYLPLAIDFSQVNDHQDSFNDDGWSNRKDFLWVGNRKQNPNDDSLKYLLQVLWPSIHAEIPEAELHIVGPNRTESQRQLIAKTKSVVDLGWVDDLPKLMMDYRVNLAPLRFGAGLKGKIMQPLALGLPTVSSAIGAEGLFIETISELAPAKSADEFIAKSIRLYKDKPYWQQAKTQGIRCMEQHFSLTHTFAGLQENLRAIKNDLDTHRKRHFMGQILQHQSLNATKYMGRWLTLKNQDISPE